MIQILALTKYGRAAASTRQRFVQFAPVLRNAGISLECLPLFQEDYTAAITSGQRQNMARIALSYLRRLVMLAQRSSADIVWIQYELFPYLPAPLERLAFVMGKPILVDYDDAFFLNYDLHSSPLARRLLSGKMRPLISRAAGITAGNQYLAAYVRQWNDRVTIIPTVVDTEVYVPVAHRRTRQPTIGWIGSASTWAAYVRPYLALLQEICSATGARFLVVGAGEGAEQDNFGGMELRDWSEEREVADIQEMDIGIMPLPDDAWARAKCGYKLIQYMACGLPVVASPVGVNQDIVSDGDNGFLANSPKEWRDALLRLLCDPALSSSLGTAGRQRAVQNYSLHSQAPRLIELFNSLAHAERGGLR